MWPFRKRQQVQYQGDLRAYSRTYAPTRGDILDALPDDNARFDQCMSWAEEERNKFYQGLRESIRDILGSDSDQFAQYDGRARTRIGEQRWSNSRKSKELAGNEQMYMRWAEGYKHSPRHGLGRRGAA
jgi:hypothetical protein